MRGNKGGTAIVELLIASYGWTRTSGQVAESSLSRALVRWDRKGL